MKKDIVLTTPYEITMHKKLWAESELSLARCLSFTHDIDASTITCDLTVTSRTSIDEFLKECFVNVWTNPLEAEFKSKVINKLDFDYGNMRVLFNMQVLPKLGYEDKLYAHQSESLFVGVKKKHNFFALDQGLGKTLIASSISKMLSFKRTLIVCPSSLKHNWLKEMTGPISKFNELYISLLDANKGRTIRAFQERFVICNYESLEKHMAHILSSPFQHIIIDECFPYNTLIHTDKGFLKIGDIVEKELFCNVLSYDSLNSIYLYKPVVNFFKKTLTKKLVKIKYDGGQLVCTEDHKIWTKEGYRMAKNLRGEDFVCLLQRNSLRRKQGSQDTQVLFPFMLKSKRVQPLEQKQVLCHSIVSFLQKRFFHPKKREGNFCVLQPEMQDIAQISTINNKLSNLPKRIPRNSEPQQTVLRNKMFCDMENERQRNEIEKSLRPSENVEFCKKEVEGLSWSSCENDGREKEHDFRTSGISNQKNGNNIKRKNIFGERWKWSTNKTAVNSSRINKPANGASNRNGFCKTFIQKCTSLLQSGFGLHRKKDSDRSGRKNSQIEEVEIFGSSENGNFKFVRVDSVEILERGSGSESELVCPTNYVYDIEVADNHNYFADNILVSNCVKIKSTSTRNFKMADKIVEANPDAKVTLLSGSPIRNRINDLFAYLKLIKHPLGSNYSHFIREYTISSKGRGNSLRITGAKNTELLWRQTSNFMLRKKKEDCLDLPPKIYSKLHFSLDDYKEEYDKAVYEALEKSGKTNLNSSVHSINIVTSKAKLKGIIEFIDNIIEQGEKIVVFSGYTTIVEELQMYFKDKCVLVNGPVNSLERSVRVERFQTDDTCQVFIGQTLAAGMGLTLTAASNTVFCDFPFSPADLVQAEDRTHRIGQSKTVNIYYAMCSGSIDEHLYQLIVDKAHDAARVIDNKGIEMGNNNLAEVLISKLREEYNIPEKLEVSDGETEIK